MVRTRKWGSLFSPKLDMREPCALHNNLIKEFWGCCKIERLEAGHLFWRCFRWKHHIQSVHSVRRFPAYGSRGLRYPAFSWGSSTFPVTKLQTSRLRSLCILYCLLLRVPLIFFNSVILQLNIQKPFISFHAFKCKTCAPALKEEKLKNDYITQVKENIWVDRLELSLFLLYLTCSCRLEIAQSRLRTKTVKIKKV